MSLQHKKLDDISIADIKYLRDEGIGEKRVIEYKRLLNIDKPEDKKKFLE